MREKRGQFYLMAIVLIVLAIAAMITILNYSKRTNYLQLNELKEELQIEGAYVLDYDFYNQEDRLSNFTEAYSEYLQPAEIYFIVGDSSDLELYTYNYSSGGEKEDLDYTLSDSTVTVNVAGNDYDFELREGKNFYFMIVNKIGGEKYVVTNQI